MLASWTFGTVLKRFRSFNAENLRSADQRAAKLPAIKLWEWFDFARVRTRADWFKWGRGRMADFFMRPPTLKAGNFEALWLIDPIFTALKVLNPLKRYFKHQEASYNFKLGFALSNRPHFNSVYLVRVPLLTGIAVYKLKSLQVIWFQHNNSITASRISRVSTSIESIPILTMPAPFL